MSGDNLATGRIILLNGTSSAGKSSIAAELLRILDYPYFHIPVDGINAMRADGWAQRLGPDHFTTVLTRTVLGFHRAVAGMAMAGNNVVMDHVLREPEWLDDCLRVLAGIEVVFVGVVCPLPELIRRERARGDRQIGRAEHQFPRVHTHGEYDVECDSDRLTPLQCAETITDYSHPPRAFQRLREVRNIPPCDSGVPFLEPPRCV